MSAINTSSMSRFFKHYWSLVLLALTVLFSIGLYFSEDYKLERLLTSYEWQGKTNSRIDPDQLDELVMLKSINQHGHIVYLPNKTYSRVTTTKLFSESDKPLSIHITEYGNWEISGGYLITNPSSFKDITSGLNQDFQQKHIDLVHKVYEMNAQKSRRIDVINDSTIILSGLNGSSNTYYAQ